MAFPIPGRRAKKTAPKEPSLLEVPVGKSLSHLEQCLLAERALTGLLLDPKDTRDIGNPNIGNTYLTQSLRDAVINYQNAIQGLKEYPANQSEWKKAKATAEKIIQKEAPSSLKKTQQEGHAIAAQLVEAECARQNLPVRNPKTQLPTINETQKAALLHYGTHGEAIELFGKRAVFQGQPKVTIPQTTEEVKTEQTAYRGHEQMYRMAHRMGINISRDDAKIFYEKREHAPKEVQPAITALEHMRDATTNREFSKAEREFKKLGDEAQKACKSWLKKEASSQRELGRQEQINELRTAADNPVVDLNITPATARVMLAQYEAEKGPYQPGAFNDPGYNKMWMSGAKQQAELVIGAIQKLTEPAMEPEVASRVYERIATRAKSHPSAQALLDNINASAERAVVTGEAISIPIGGDTVTKLVKRAEGGKAIGKAVTAELARQPQKEATAVDAPAPAALDADQMAQSMGKTGAAIKLLDKELARLDRQSQLVQGIREEKAPATDGEKLTLALQQAAQLGEVASAESKAVSKELAGLNEEMRFIKESEAPLSERLQQAETLKSEYANAADKVLGGKVGETLGKKQGLESEQKVLGALIRDAVAAPSSSSRAAGDMAQNKAIVAVGAQRTSDMMP